jgi:hypothetical protein
MSDASNAFGFGKFVPGFDFLQSLTKGSSDKLPQMPSLSNWVAPTINVEELEKRIAELKAVQFWLDQNASALKATIQALEVQKMTLATLEGMNFSLGDVANAFKLKATDSMFAGFQAAAPAPAPASAPAAEPPAAPKPRRRPAAGSAQAAAASAATGVVDPLQWWGALSQQFQQIANNAMKDAAVQAALDTTRNMATGMAKDAIKSASDMAGSVTRSAADTVAAATGRAPKPVAKKAPARKAAARKKPATR